MQRPFILILIAFISGILTGSYFTPCACLLLSATVIILAGILISLKKKWLRITWILLIGFAFIAGFFNIQKQDYLSDAAPSVSNYIDQGKVTVEAFVIDTSASSPEQEVLIVNSIRLLREKEYLPVSGKIKLIIPTDSNFEYGDFIRFHATLKKIHPFNNPGSHRSLRLSHWKGMDAAGYIQDKSGIILLRKKTGNFMKQSIESFRLYLKKIISQNVSSPQKEIIQAMTIGTQNEIPDDIREIFNITGTSHILSISGLHVGMIASISFLFFLSLLKTSEFLMLRFNIFKLAAVGAFLVVLLYSWTAGMGVPVLRAMLMAFFFLLAMLLGKQKDLYHVLAMAALMILLISPEAIWEISFQLSFVSVLAIIYIVPQYSDVSFLQTDVLPGWSKVFFKFVYLSTWVSLAATIGTLPIILYYFNRISFISIIANLLIVPLLGTLTLSVLLCFIFASLFSSFLAGCALKLASLLTWISIVMIQHLASLKWSSANLPQPSICEIVLFYIIVFFTFQYLGERKNQKKQEGSFSGIYKSSLKYLWMVSFFLLAADILYDYTKDRFSSVLRITAIDVGQGNSILARLPHGYNMLIDGGGFAESSFDVGKAVVAPFLYHEKIRRMDTVVLSHPHPDHLLGLIFIMNHFNTTEAWTSSLPVNEDEFPQWGKVLSTHNIKRFILSAESPEMIIEGVRFKILWPPALSQEKFQNLSYQKTNDFSLVLKITFGKISFLLPGDISSTVENKLIASGTDLRSDVLIIPHHGSRRSSSRNFIKAVGCRYAVASSGKSSVFQHPHSPVLQKYREMGANIFRTDLHGAITFTTDGKELHAQSYIPIHEYFSQ